MAGDRRCGANRCCRSVAVRESLREFGAERSRCDGNTYRFLSGVRQARRGRSPHLLDAKLGPAFSDIVDPEFHPEGVIYGHFLSATSEDAVVSGWSAETNPYLWNSTLLLTKGSGTWKPLW